MELTNREVALLGWATLIVLAILVRATGRRAVAGLIASLRGKVALIVLAYAGYVAAMVVGAACLGLWTTDLVKDTIAWFLLPGLTLLFTFNKAYEQGDYYTRTIARVVGLTALVEFYVNLVSFQLWFELILVPVVALLTAISVFSRRDPKLAASARWADRILALLGVVALAATAAYVAYNWAQLDLRALGLKLVMPIWLTIATLPFIFFFSLFANYETHFARIGWFAGDNTAAKRRAKIVLLAHFRLRNRELGRFPGSGDQDLARASSWREAAKIIRFRRAEARVTQAKDELKHARLIRFAGVNGYDGDGRPVDQREFEETKNALHELHEFHTFRHEEGRYRGDMMTITAGLLSKTFPESEIKMSLGPRARSWYAWRRTVAGWVFGIGASGAPPDLWTWEGPTEPLTHPGPGSDWTHDDFRDSD